MPAVCHEALDQLYAYNRRKRQQYYFLSKLVPSCEEFNKGSKARTALEVIVHEKKLDLINHTVIQKFIRWAEFLDLFFPFNEFSVLWENYGRKEAMKQFCLSFLFLALWTAVAVGVPSETRFIYIYPTDGWRIFVFLLAITLTFYMIWGEYQEYRTGQ